VRGEYKKIKQRFYFGAIARIVGEWGMSSRWQNAVYALLAVVGCNGAFAAAPSITSEVPRYASVGSPYQYQVVASDSDSTGALTYAFQNPPSGMTVGSSGLVTWMPTHGYFEHVEVWLSVTDSDGERTLQLLDLVVDDPTNHDPEISSHLPVSVGVGSTLDFSLGATDSDGDTLTYTLYLSPPGTQFDAVTGRITYTPVRSDVGRQEFLARVTDNLGGAAWFDQSLDVVDATNHAPEYGAFPQTTINVGETLDYTIAAADADGDSLTYSLYLKPQSTVFDALTGHILWTPTRSEVGQQEFYWVARDNFGGEAHHDHNITVIDPNNHAPQVQSLPPSTLNVGDALDYTIDATDADGDTLHFSLYQKPESAQFDSSTGRIQWSPVRAQVGPQEFIWIIRDDFGGETFTDVTINIVDPNNHVPVVGSTAPTSVQLGASYQYQVQVTDGDNDEVSYRLYFSPSGMTISDSGLVAWTPTADQVGENEFKVAVSDDFGGLVTQHVRVTVTDGNSTNDDDGDGVPNADDAFPADPSESVDTDGDGTGNNADTDDDNDGVNDTSDSDTDGDGYSNDEEVAAGSDPDNASSIPGSTPPSCPTSPSTAELLPLIQSPTFRATSTTYEMDSGNTTLSPQHYSEWLGVIATALSSAERDARNAAIQTAADVDAQRAPTGTVQIQAQRVTLHGDCSSALQVFTVAASSIPQAAAFELDCVPLTSQIIVNVSGTSLTLTNQHRFESLSTVTGPITFNAHEATSLQLNGVRLYGSLRAPHAVMSQPRGVVVGKIEARHFHTPLANLSDIADYATPVTLKQSCQPPRRMMLASMSADQSAISIADDDVTWLVHADAVHADPAPAGHVAHDNYSAVNVSQSTFGLGVHGVYDGNGTPPLSDALTLSNNAEHYWEKLFLATQHSDATPLPIRLASLTMPYARPDVAAITLYNETDNSARSLGGEHYVGKSLLRLDDQDTKQVWIGSPGSTLNPGTQFKFSVAPGGQYSVREIGYLVNTGPVWITQSLPAATTGTAFKTTLRAGDNDCEELQFVLTSGPAGLVVDAATGQLTWSSPIAGDHAVALQVRDSNGAATPINLVLHVESGANVNHDPHIVSTAITGAVETQTYHYQVVAEDADNDALTYTLVLGPNGMTIDAGTGAIDWIPQYTDTGNHAVSVLVTDGNGGSATQQFTIVVANTNRAPLITSTPVTSTNEGSVYAYQVLAADSDGDILSFAVLAAPAGMSINTQTGLLSWTPTYSAAGNYSVQVQVTDTFGATDAQSFTLTVNNVNHAPQITSSPVTTSNQGALYAYHVVANDADNETLNYTLALPPVGMTIDASSGDIAWTPGFFDVGTHTIAVQVSDTSGASAQQTYSLTVVAAPNHAPEITSQPVLVAVAGKPYNYAVSTTDADGDDVTLQLSGQPAGMTLNTSSNTVIWESPAMGVYPITLTATDTQGASAQQHYQLQVVAEQPPVTTQGKEFWLMFNTQASARPNLLLYISSSVHANVSVSIDGLNYQSSHQVAANTIKTVDLSEYLRLNLNYSGIANNAVHIVSDAPVSVYLINQVTMTTDASLVLPLAALGTHYRAISYAANDVLIAGGLNIGNFLGIVATEDDTVITIHPETDIDDSTGSSAYRAANETYEITLDKGQTYQAQVDGHGYGGSGLELTGTSVIANKPIAFFSGDQCAAVRTLYCDHLVEQLPPINSWASEYITLPLATRRNGDTFRILAAENQTYVWINDVIVAYLNAGEFYESLIDGSSRIVGSKPILVAQFANGSSFDGVLGDPFMVLVPPVDQFLSSYNITTPVTGYRANFANIIAPAAAAASVRVDGNVVPSNLWVATPGSDLVGAQMPVAIGQHNVVADQPFGLYAYGFDQFDSYGYLGGMALSEQTTFSTLDLVVDDETPQAGDEICAYAQLFDVDGNVAAQQQVLFTRHVAGLIRQYSRLTDITGIAQYCYIGAGEGAEVLEASAQTLNKNTTISWRAKGGGGNQPPQIISMPPMFAVPGEQYQYQVIARDPDLDPIQYQLIESPSGMSVDPATGSISWSTARNFVQTWITVRVSDGHGSTTQRYRLSNVPGANHYPDFTSQPVLLAMTGRAYTYTMTASDVDGGNLYFSLVSGPEGMAVSGSKLTWTPGVDDVGIHTVTVEVSDEGGFYSVQTFFLEVELNLPPQFTLIPGLSAITSHTYIGYYKATDDNADSLTYRLVTGPSGMTISNYNTLYVRWTPTSDQVGDHQVIIEADDTFGGVTQQVYTVSVRANQPPTFTSVPPTTAIVGHQYRYNYVTQDADGDPFSYYATLISAPAGMGVNSSVYWTPTASQVGQHQVQLRRDDGFGGAAIQTFTINVLANQNPVITSAPKLNGITGHPYVYLAAGTDGDADPVSFSLVSGPAGLSVQAAYQVVWTPTAQQAGSHNVIIAASDGKGGVTQQAFAINVAANKSPQFTSKPVYGGKVGSNGYRYTMAAADADSDAVTYRLVSGPSGMTTSTSLLFWSPTASQVGVFPVTVEAKDQYGGASQQQFDVTIVNGTLEITHYPASPVIVNDELYSFTVEAIHPTNLAVQFSLPQAPSGMSINSSSGVLQWTPTVAQIGSHTVTLRAFDNQSREDSVTFTVQVTENTNTAPVITSQPTTTAKASAAYSYAVVATDAESHAMTYSLRTSPSGMAISAAGLISWTPTVAQEGVHAVTLRVTDERGRYSEQSYSITVHVNHAPQITGTPFTSAAVGQDYHITLQATDVDGDTLSFGVSSAPAGFSIGYDDGVVHWTPTASQVGDQSVSITISDGTATILVSWTIHVSADIVPLEISVTPTPQVIQQNAQTTISISTSGGVAQPSVQLQVDGASVALNAQSQATVTGTSIGRHEIVVTAYDGAQARTVYSWFSVADPADTTSPVVEIQSPSGGARITSPVDIVGTVQDAHLAEVKLLFRRTDSADWTELYSGSSAFDGQAIAQFDPTQLVNGLYHILLQATDANGQKSNVAITVVVDGDLKVGNFSFTVQDLAIPVSGIPVRVTRTYDSRRKGEALDFGHGWSVGYQDARVEESSEPSEGWYQQRNYMLFTIEAGADTQQVTFNATCVYPFSDKTVTVTLPSGDVERFTAHAVIIGGGQPADADPDCYMLGGRFHELRFTPEGDTQSTLTSVDGTSLYLTNLDNGNLADVAETSPWPITHYRLTTRNGYVYDLNQNFGIEKVTDPNGNTLTYSAAGIVHSSGLSVLFNRDTAGRITSITDPAGHVAMTYQYNDSGDLISATDALTARTQYTYNADHGLLDIIDPLGRPVVKNIYDDDGRLIAQEDNAGNRREFAHNLDGRQSVVTDRNGNATVFYYDDRGNVLNKQDALGGITQYTYDARDNQLSETNALGHAKTATFNSTDDQLTQTDANNHTVAFEYNARGQETKVTDARGNAYEQTYDTVGNLLTIKDPLGHTASNWIDAKGQVTQTRDLVGNDTHYSYDTHGNRLTETDALGVVTHYTYDANNNKLTQTRQRTLSNGSTVDETTTYTYDVRNRLLSTTDPLGRVTRTEYDLVGNAIATIDAKGRRTETDYDPYGRVTQMRYPDGSSESKTYDVEGNLLTETDRAGRTTTFVYDQLNRLISTTYADGTQMQTDYDAAGQVVAQTDARGSVTQFEYDHTGKRTATIDALNHRHETAFDASGNVLTDTDALNHDTNNVWNTLDQKVQTQFANGNTTADNFDALGRKTSHTDEASITTGYQYDALGKLVAVIDVQNNATSYTYDQAGNKLTQTDAEGRITRWTYDALGRVLTRALPLGQTESFTYDATGNVVTHTDFNGGVTTNTYSANNDRLLTLTYQDGSSESYTYTASGKVATVTQTDTGGSRVTSNVYDTRDRLTQQTQADGSVLQYQYDANGNRTQVSVTRNSATYVTYYVYDALNRLTQVTDADGNLTTYTYDAVGNKQGETKANGNKVAYQYDERNRLTELTHRAANNSVLQQFSYTLHPTGRRLQIDEANGRTTVYGYNYLYALESETITDAENGDYSASYGYDGVGNRTEETINGVTTEYTVDANDRLTQKGSTTYTYDNNGNTLTETDGSNITLYAYNTKNALVSVTKADVTTDFTYNASGIRTGKTQNNTTTSFVVDENRDYAQVLIEANGTDETRYTYGDDLLSQASAGETRYFHYDGLGSTRALSDSTGAVSDTYDYAAFGEELNSTGSTESSYKFTGEQFDETLNQYYLRARYYDQAIGRFTSQDSWQGEMGQPVTLHKYAYAGNDPVLMVDPSGNNYTMGSLMAGINAFAILTTAAVTHYQIGYSSAQSEAVDQYGVVGGRRWDLWDVKAATHFASAVQSSVETQARTSTDSPERHHTIPFYLCGSRDQRLVTLSHSEHVQIHGAMAIAEVALAAAEEAADQLIPLGRRTSTEKKSLAESKTGREAIGATLEALYKMGWWDAGTPQVQVVFPDEKREFIDGKTSLPECKRPR